MDTYERRDLDALWSFYSEDCRFPVLERFGVEPSWENYKRFMTTFIDAFPDLHHHIEKLVTDGENVWALYTMTGTHRGPLRGMQPTGKTVRYSIVAMYRIADGLIGGGRLCVGGAADDETARAVARLTPPLTPHGAIAPRHRAMLAESDQQHGKAGRWRFRRASSSG